MSTNRWRSLIYLITWLGRAVIKDKFERADWEMAVQIAIDKE